MAIFVVHLTIFSLRVLSIASAPLNVTLLMFQGCLPFVTLGENMAFLHYDINVVTNERLAYVHELKSNFYETSPWIDALCFFQMLIK